MAGIGVGGRPSLRLGDSDSHLARLYRIEDDDPPGTREEGHDGGDDASVGDDGEHMSYVQKYPTSVVAWSNTAIATCKYGSDRLLKIVLGAAAPQKTQLSILYGYHILQQVIEARSLVWGILDTWSFNTGNTGFHMEHLKCPVGTRVLWIRIRCEPAILPDLPPVESDLRVCHFLCHPTANHRNFKVSEA